MMEIHLPIAGTSIPLYYLIPPGLIAGIVSGLFGLGGNFILIPVLIIIGLPPDVAMSSAIASVIATSFVGSLSSWNQRRVDLKLMLWLTAGSVIGAALGFYVVRTLEQESLLDSALPIVHFTILSMAGSITLFNSIQKKISKTNTNNENPSGLLTKLIQKFPLKQYFSHSGRYISLVMIVICGIIMGFLASLSGVGVGFILIPLLTHGIGLNIVNAIALTACQTLIISTLTTLIHSYNLHTVDLVLTSIMAVLSIASVGIGRSIQPKLSPENLNILFSITALAVAIKLATQLILEPNSIYSVVIKH